MRFYNGTHCHWCGIDLHAKTLYVCILDAESQVLIHENLRSSPEAFLAVVEPYREGLVVAVECTFTWYWLADLCAREGIAFVLGHALMMKAIHVGKAKTNGSTRRRSRRCSAAGCCRRSMPTRPACERRGICCAGACTSSASAASSWPTSR